jgi:TetR/AcrR family transcriptional repressor of nem operon
MPAKGARRSPGEPTDSHRRRGRPREFDPDEVLEAAMQTFWETGYRSAAVPELAAATGLSTSSLYNEYGSKLGLFEAAFDRYLEQVIEGRMIGPLLRGQAGLADLDAYFDRLRGTIGRAAPRGCLAVNAIAEMRDPPAAVARRTGAYRRRLQAGLQAALGRAEARGEIASGSAATRAEAIVPIVIAFNLLVAAGVPGRESRALLDSARTIAAG